MSARPGRIVLAVTADISLSLMSGLPEALAEAGWDVHVVASGGERLEELTHAEGVTTHALRMSRDPAPLQDARSLIAWLRLLRRLRPQVVLAGTPKAGLLGMIAGRLTGVPTRIYHVRGLRLETTTGLLRRVLTALERLTFRCATSALCVSHSLARRITDLGLAPAQRLVVLGRGSSNGVDTTRFAPGKAPDIPGLAAGVPVIGFVGRLNRDKGLEVLSEACALLEAEGIDHQLLIVGGLDGSGTATFGGARPPVVTGHVADTAPYYRAMRLLCLPTLREGFPNVVLEASASGVAVVTTDATGAVDSVDDDVTGIVTRAGDAASLATALRRLLEDGGLAERMGAAGRRWVAAEFARPRVQGELVAHLRRAQAGAVRT